jgi:hypothetical protein
MLLMEPDICDGVGEILLSGESQGAETYGTTTTGIESWKRMSAPDRPIGH